MVAAQTRSPSRSPTHVLLKRLKGRGGSLSTPLHHLKGRRPGGTMVARDLSPRRSSRDVVKGSADACGIFHAPCARTLARPPCSSPWEFINHEEAPGLKRGGVPDLFPWCAPRGGAGWLTAGRIIPDQRHRGSGRAASSGMSSTSPTWTCPRRGSRRSGPRFRHRQNLSAPSGLVQLGQMPMLRKPRKRRP